MFVLKREKIQADTALTLLKLQTLSSQLHFFRLFLSVFKAAWSAATIPPVL